MATRISEDRLHRMGNTRILRSMDGLSDKELRAFAPTIFAKSAIDGVSEKYGFVSSASVVEQMRDNNFEVMEVRQSARRGDDADYKMGFTKHMIKFRKAGVAKRLIRGDVISQVVMLNSHDRSSAFWLMPGLYRVLCENGLLVSESSIVSPIKVPHNIKAVENVVEQSKILIQGADGVYRLRDEMLEIELSEKQQYALALAATDARPRRRKGMLDPAELLEPRRVEDDLPDLWHTWNRIQENMFRAGTQRMTEDGRKTTTQGIGRIDRDVDVNSKLWKLAVDLVEKIKQGSKGAGAVRSKTTLKAKMAAHAKLAESSGSASPMPPAKTPAKKTPAPAPAPAPVATKKVAAKKAPAAAPAPTPAAPAPTKKAASRKRVAMPTSAVDDALL